jgi:hypothetical protein
MSISLLRYTVFMQSAGTRTRGEGELSARNEDISRISAGVCRLDPLALHYNPIRRVLAVHIKQGLNSFVEILPHHYRR